MSIDNPHTPIDRPNGGPSFSAKNRLIRLAWIIVWQLFASWTPDSMRMWRVFLLRAFGARIGEFSNVMSSARVWLPSNLIMAEHSLIGPKVNCYNQGEITIGNRVLISQGAYLCSGTHDIDDPSFALKLKPITIKDYVWVAADAFVGPGCKIGEGAVIGARGVAFGMLDEWTVYSGNPVKAIRKRSQFAKSRKDHK